MRHKSERTKGEWWEMHPKLRLVLCEADYWCYRHGTELLITCLTRSELEQWALYTQKKAPSKSSVHVVLRGGDARVLTPDHLNQQLCDHINAKFPYDPKRPNLKTVIRHGGTADHLHFQVMDG